LHLNYDNAKLFVKTIPERGLPGLEPTSLFTHVNRLFRVFFIILYHFLLKSSHSDVTKIRTFINWFKDGHNVYLLNMVTNQDTHWMTSVLVINIVSFLYLESRLVFIIVLLYN